ncbi:MAG: Rrf2 family transcriptional regulator [Ignavibacteria bacterium]|nr:MAG: Rrf2 family transcriptional regulator [Ignavibacteria bacterium]
MFQLSKKVEYGLIAIRHMAAGGPGQIHTAKEIADRYHIPYELLAKVMQKLAKNYILARNPAELKVAAIINAIEGKPNVTIIQCEAESPENCIIHDTCTIKNPLVKLQLNINRVFEDLSIGEMV